MHPSTHPPTHRAFTFLFQIPFFAVKFCSRPILLFLSHFAHLMLLANTAPLLGSSPSLLFRPRPSCRFVAVPACVHLSPGLTVSSLEMAARTHLSLDSKTSTGPHTCQVAINVR